MSLYEGHVVPERIEGYLPLRDYALLGDGRTCALVGADGAVDWWALPTMADAPVFGALLDADRGGRLLLRPVAPYEVGRCYADGGGVLQTDFRTADGTVRVTDALTLGSGSALPWSELARRVEALDGTVAMRWEVAPGDGFGTTAGWAHEFNGLPLIDVDGVRLALVLHAAGEPERRLSGFAGTFTARPGEPAMLAILATSGEPTAVPSADAIARRVRETASHWAQWRRLVQYEGPWRDAVVRSALVHKQLTYAPTGGLQAATTTSLPERIGSSENFDYRFSWVRDTGFALDALSSLELRSEVHAMLTFLLRAVAATSPDVRVFYTMDGEPGPADIQQVRLWRGYRDSAPVKVGNNAASQRQLGAYGDLLEAIHRYCAHGNVLDAGTGRMVGRTADQVCAQWQQDDAGLWELGRKRPYTSSKIGCWAALDRAASLADAGQIPGGQAGRWREVARQIHDYVDHECWSDAKNAYCFYAGSDDLDCAALLAARTGFCSGDDPRLAGTIDAIRRELSAGGPLLYRYTGVQEKEGAFIACSFWLVEALCAAGRLTQAREVMDGMVGLANDVGLYSEQIDPDSKELLGNMPQTLSHLALISAATAYGHAVGGA